MQLAGGTVVVLDPEKAMQPGMPESVIRSGYATLVGDVDQIIAWLNDVGALTPLQRMDDASVDRDLADVIRRVGEQTGFEVDRYKDGTLRRQIVRRYGNLGLSSLAEYLERLNSDPDELRCLQQSFLISVTAFFRDREVFDSLARTLALRLADIPAGSVFRVWVPGCATGEESYSIAILIAEILGERLNDVEIKIFATDIDPEALDVARAGLYSTEALMSVGSERVQRWFVAENGSWRVAKSIRGMCTFANHNVISHPPFMNLDLVSCRNLLIYFKPEQQKDLIAVFHYGLQPDGLLMLGHSESTGFQSRLFEPIDGHRRIYRRLAARIAPITRFATYSAGKMTVKPRLDKPESSSQRRPLVDAAQNIIARRYGSPAVLVNAGFEPFHFFGQSQRYFRLPEENFDFSLFNLILPELRSELKILCYRMTQDNLTFIEGSAVAVSLDGAQQFVRPVVQRIDKTENPGEHALLILFDIAAPITVTAVPAVDSTGNGTCSAELFQLRQELADTREHLQAVIEELEASNEELQSLNEELQSSSEELQAANEELQSSNEELTTLNDELRMKSQEASELNNTLTNIQNSMSSSLVVVDQDGRISRYNELVTRVFGLVSRDIGQSLFGVPCHLNLPQLREQIRLVVRSGESVVERVHQDDYHFLMQIDPYHNERGVGVGALLTFTDISDLYHAEQLQAQSERRFRKVWEASLDGLMVVDQFGLIDMVNPGIERMFGYESSELIGQPVELLIPQAYRDAHVALRSGFFLAPEQRRMAPMRDLRAQRKDGSMFFVEISLSSMLIEDRNYVVVSVNDIDNRKKAELELRQSQENLQLALDAARAGNWEWDLASNGNVWSGELWRLYGLGEDVIPSFDAWKMSIAPEDCHRIITDLEAAVAEHREFEFDWRVNLPAGEHPRWLMARGRPILGANGLPERYIGIVMDISERKQAELELDAHRGQLEALVVERTRQITEANVVLKEKERFIRTVTDAFQSMIGYWDDQLRCGFANGAYLEWFGKTPDEMYGMRIQDLLGPELFAKNEPYIRSVLKGEPQVFERTLTKVDGSTGYTLASYLPDYRDGKVCGFFVMVNDVTKLKVAEIKLDALNVELERRAEAAESTARFKSAFLANMSHEIRTPMNGIVGMAQLIRRSGLPSDQNERMLKLEAACEHLLGIINAILDLSKIEAGKFELVESELQVDQVVGNVIAILRQAALVKGLRLRCEIEQMPCLKGDVTRLQQALLNYAGNAIKFTECGGVTLRCKLIDESQDSVLIRFEVEDTGIGIEPEAIGRMFVAFEQADNTITRRYGGTGLGLAITKKIAELMGGNAGVESILGKGSTFWFTVRLGKSLDPVDLPVLSVEEGEHILQSKFGGTRILLVEDEPINQEVAKCFLEDIGMDVSIASNGVEAVEFAAATNYSVILMDMQMPELDGLEATRRIRNLPQHQNTPILAMTANAFAEDRDRCLKAGMSDFMSKPIKMETLVELLIKWLSGN